MRLGGFVADHQDRFSRVWKGQCDSMVRATTNLLWVNAVVAVAITAGMFWMFLRNHLEEYRIVATQFLVLVMAGLLAPLVYLAWQKWSVRLQREPASDDYLSCSDDGDFIGGGSTAVAAMPSMLPTRRWPSEDAASARFAAPSSAQRGFSTGSSSLTPSALAGRLNRARTSSSAACAGGGDGRRRTHSDLEGNIATSSAGSSPAMRLPPRHAVSVGNAGAAPGASDAGSDVRMTRRSKSLDVPAMMRARRASMP